MYIHPIASGSTGNCLLLKSQNASILIDFGISLLALEKVLGKETISMLDGVLITHEHIDHIKGLKSFGKKHPSIPVYMNNKSYEARKNQLDTIDHRNLAADHNIKLKDLTLSPFDTKHDTCNSLGFIIDDGVNSLGYLTDTGCVTELIRDKLMDVDILFIESDYDVKALVNCEEYNSFLKNRISSDLGHLSNDQALEVIDDIGVDNLKKVFFGHLSLRTNSPKTILTLAEKKFPTNKNKFLVAPTNAITIS